MALKSFHLTLSGGNRRRIAAWKATMVWFTSIGVDRRPSPATGYVATINMRWTKLSSVDQRSSRATDEYAPRDRRPIPDDQPADQGAADHPRFGGFRHPGSRRVAETAL